MRNGKKNSRLIDNIKIPPLNREGLREFGFVCATIIALLFGLFFPVVINNQPLPELSVPFQVALGLASIALFIPMLLKPIYTLWMSVALVLGWINTRLILALTFFLLLTPIAFILKLLRQDAMQRKIISTLKSYRTPSQQQPKHQMEKPY